MSHKHKWEEIGRAFAQSPVRNVKAFKLTDYDKLARLIFGVTVIELRCRKCGTVGKQEIEGDHTGSKRDD